MRSQKWVLMLLGLAACCTLAACARQGSPEQVTTYPTKPITYICHVTAGGASDVFTREVARMLQDEKIIPVAITVENHPGGSGAVAANYLKGKAGDPYYLLNVGDAFVLGPLRDPTVPGYKDFTPIARLAFDVTCVIVRADSPYMTMRDLILAGQKSPGSIAWGVTTVGGFNHMTVLLLQERTGAKFNIVNFTDASESLAALLGGHIQVITTEPAQAKAQADAGKVRILGVVSDDRVSTVPDVPTLKEQGYDVVLYMHRGVVAPAGIPDYAKAYLQQAFEKLTQTDAWKRYTSGRGLINAFAAGDEYVKFLEEETRVKGHLLELVGK